jgi:hypothetical protein
LGITSEKKAQAAVTDAIYFLLIVTGLCVFLFAFSNDYGSAVSEQIESQENSEFITNALQTIMHSSVPRNPSNLSDDCSEECCSSLSHNAPCDLSVDLYADPIPEIDRLLAFIKEDFGDDKKLSYKTMYIIHKNIESVMAPKSDSFDYLFYITILGSATGATSNTFVYILFHNPDYSDPDNIVQKDYFCGIPENYFNDPDITENTWDGSAIFENVSLLTARVGETYQSEARLNLGSETDAEAFEPYFSQVNLVVWPSTSLLDYAGGENFTGVSGGTKWCCIEIESPDPSTGIPTGITYGSGC